MKLIDSHCHLNSDFGPKTCTQLVEEAQLAGVETLITIGTDFKSLPTVQKISENHKNVYHTVGVHPHDTAQTDLKELDELERAATHPKCRAIGEIGLDYHYSHSPQEIQRDLLEQQLEVALKTRLPVVIHSRDAENDLLLFLTQYAQKASGIPGVIHCFSGTLEFGKKCLDLGFYLSFSGILTFKKADEIRQAAKFFPLERLLIETDSPYLAPVPFRGKKCEPSMIVYTALKLAEIKEISIEQVAEITTENTQKIFQL